MKLVNRLRISILPMIFFVFLAVVISINIAIALKDRGVTNSFVDFMTKHVTIQAVATDDIWEQKYPYEGIVSYKNKIDAFKKRIEAVCTTSMIGSESINNLVNVFENRIYHYDIGSIEGGYENKQIMRKYLSQVEEFAEEMNGRGYDFMYISTPTLFTQNYLCGKREGMRNIELPERRIAFDEDIRETSINYLDIAECCLDDIVYDDSGHWMQESVIEGSGYIIDRLNRDYGYKFDPSLYEYSNFHNIISEREGLSDEIYDKYSYYYEILVPNSPGEYEITIADGECISGDFREVLVTDSDEWNEWGDPYHSSTRIRNSLFYKIENEQPNNNQGKTIVIVGDSMDWALCGYLAQDISTVYFIHNGSFTGSVLSLIDSINPDTVLMIYSDASMSDTYIEGAYMLK